MGKKVLGKARPAVRARRDEALRVWSSRVEACGLDAADLADRLEEVPSRRVPSKLENEVRAYVSEGKPHQRRMASAGRG